MTKPQSRSPYRDAPAEQRTLTERVRDHVSTVELRLASAPEQVDDELHAGHFGRYSTTSATSVVNNDCVRASGRFRACATRRVLSVASRVSLRWSQSLRSSMSVGF
jgi:hypothetical protein